MEDRNCINSCDYDVTGINAAFGINSMSNSKKENLSCNQKDKIGTQMLEKIRCLSFAITDLAEYLNTHREDKKAICLHREYCNELRNLKDKYQKVYGPLSIYCPCNSWRWLEEQWPWEGEEE